MIFLDTHVIVWLYAGLSNKISPKATQYINCNELLISQMVKLELQYLFEIKRISVPPKTIINGLNNSINLKVSSMEVEEVFNYAVECSWTRDVFDRLITAEAGAKNLVLISKYKNILSNYKKAVW